MRKRKNSWLVYSTDAENKAKQAIASKNKGDIKIFFMNTFGKRRRITKEEYDRLKKVGYNVEERTI